MEAGIVTVKTNRPFVCRLPIRTPRNINIVVPADYLCLVQDREFKGHTMRRFLFYTIRGAITWNIDPASFLTILNIAVIDVQGNLQGNHFGYFTEKCTGPVTIYGCSGNYKWGDSLS